MCMYECLRIVYTVCVCVCVCGVCASMVYRALCLSLCVCGGVCARVWFIVLSVCNYVHAGVYMCACFVFGMQKISEFQYFVQLQDLGKQDDISTFFLYVFHDCGFTGLVCLFFFCFVPAFVFCQYVMFLR